MAATRWLLGNGIVVRLGNSHFDVAGGSATPNSDDSKKKDADIAPIRGIVSLCQRRFARG